MRGCPSPHPASVRKIDGRVGNHLVSRFSRPLAPRPRSEVARHRYLADVDDPILHDANLQAAGARLRNRFPGPRRRPDWARRFRRARSACPVAGRSPPCCWCDPSISTQQVRTHRLWLGCRRAAGTALSTSGLWLCHCQRLCRRREPTGIYRLLRRDRSPVGDGECRERERLQRWHREQTDPISLER